MHEDIDEVDKIAIRTLLTFALYGYRYPLNKGLLYGDADPQEGRLHYPAYAALFAVEGKTDCSWKLDSISRLCPDFVTVEKEYHYDHQISLRVQHVSVQEYLVQKQPLHFSFEAGHGFLATLCMDHWSGGEGLDEYSGMWWADHLRSLKGAAEKSGRRPLYSDENSLKESMLRFLGETESSPAFVNWCRSVIHWSDGRYDIMSRGIGMYWVSTPPSSIYACIALHLSLEGLPAAELDSRCPNNEINALHFAVGKNNVQAISELIKRGIGVRSVDKNGRGVEYYQQEPVDADVTAALRNALGMNLPLDEYLSEQTGAKIVD